LSRYKKSLVEVEYHNYDQINLSKGTWFGYIRIDIKVVIMNKRPENKLMSNPVFLIFFFSKSLSAKNFLFKAQCFFLLPKYRKQNI
jgi:hypothetical protein